jgi:hypothetical protein
MRFYGLYGVIRAGWVKPAATAKESGVYFLVQPYYFNEDIAHKAASLSSCQFASVSFIFTIAITQSGFLRFFASLKNTFLKTRLQ